MNYRRLAIKICLGCIVITSPLRAAHPELLVSAADHDAMVAKVRDVDWARSIFTKMKANVDRCMALAHDDPAWLSSRLAMNWKTHFITAVCEKSRCVGGEGHTDIPTPRFAGARNWATPYGTPADIADFLPNNDDDQGRIHLNGKWVQPQETGRSIETINIRIMQLAADASFIYWITGDERYARFATDALWTYMRGYAEVTPPKIPAGDKSMSNIIGTTSFEVIHEDIVTPLAVSYDFLYEELKREGKDPSIIQAGLKRMIDRVIAGGGRIGNWNLNQARIISYGALALEPDEAYPDHHGRPYYVNIVLNADLPNQQGIVQVIKNGFEPTTALWPEAGGYGFSAAKDLTLIASLIGNDPAGAAVLRDRILTRNIFAQANFTYPNGLAVGLGDTSDTRLNAEQLELLIAAARARGDDANEDKLTALLVGEIQTGHAQRGAGSDEMIALTRDVSMLKPVMGSVPIDRTFFAKPLNALLQRNLGRDGNSSFAVAMYGTEGGHIHSNGLAIELYGAGLTLGADPGRGDSYWTTDHAQYYSQPPAHNTVIINARSNYPAYGASHEAMTLEHLEPASGATAMSPNISYATASFGYSSPIEARQQRTLALIRTGISSGCYVDIFRSHAAASDASEFHDYLYHDIGQSVEVDGGGSALPFASTDRLTKAPDALVGYHYFTDERSLNFSGEIHASFEGKSDGTEPVMNLWMPGRDGRTIFTVNAPADHEMHSKSPMPTLVVRQTGPAWDQPFIAVFEPAINKHASMISRVRKLDIRDTEIAGCAIEEHDGSTVSVIQDNLNDRPQIDSEGISFAGHFGVAIRKQGAVTELYLGHGKAIGDQTVMFEADKPIDASLVRIGDAWQYSSSGPVRLRLASGKQILNLPAAINRPVDH